MPADDGKESTTPDPNQPIELEPIELEPPRPRPTTPMGATPEPEPSSPPLPPLSPSGDTYDLQDGHDLPDAPASPQGVPLELEETGEAVEAEAEPSPAVAAATSRPVFKADEPEEVTWPDTVGGLCMLLAGVGLLYHGLTLAGQTLDLTGSWHYLWRDRPEPNHLLLIPNMILEAVLLGVELMLLYGGFAMKLRWISSVPALRAWAGVKIVLVILRSLRDAALLVMPVYRLVTQQPPDSTWGHYQTAFMVMLLMLTFAWGLVLPVFLLMLFRRKSIQDELATWG